MPSVSTAADDLRSSDAPLLASLTDPHRPAGCKDEPENQPALEKAKTIPLAARPPQGTPPPEGSGAKHKVSRLGQYRLLKRLGGGGMGDMYKARHAKLERIVALKVLSKHLTKDHAVARFNREMKIVAKLDHPNIVRATDAGEELGFHYLVMDLVEGHDLSAVVKRLGPLSVADACEAGGPSHMHFGLHSSTRPGAPRYQAVEHDGG